MLLFLCLAIANVSSFTQALAPLLSPFLQLMEETFTPECGSCKLLLLSVILPHSGVDMILSNFPPDSVTKKS